MPFQSKLRTLARQTVLALKNPLALSEIKNTQFAPSGSSLPNLGYFHTMRLHDFVDLGNGPGETDVYAPIRVVQGTVKDVIPEG